MPSWQFALSATDANRFSIRLARHVPGRPKVVGVQLVLPRDDTSPSPRSADGTVVARSGNLGPPVALAETTRVVEFNDIEGLEREVAHGDVRPSAPSPR